MDGQHLILVMVIALMACLVELSEGAKSPFLSQEEAKTFLRSKERQGPEHLKCNEFDGWEEYLKPSQSVQKYQMEMAIIRSPLGIWEKASLLKKLATSSMVSMDHLNILKAGFIAGGVDVSYTDFYPMS